MSFMKNRFPAVMTAGLLLALWAQTPVNAAPKPQWYDNMDFGPALQTCVGLGKETVLKGVAVRVGPDHQYTFVYDTEMMSLNAVRDGWLAIAGTPWNGSHGGLPSLGGDAVFVSELGPGWAHKGSFDDPRESGYGPLPGDRAKYKGRFVHGEKTILRYTVGSTEILEMPAIEKVGDTVVFSRTLNIGKTSKEMTARVLNTPGREVALLGQGDAAGDALRIGVIGKGATLTQPEKGVVLLNVAKGGDRTLKIVMAAGAVDPAKCEAPGVLFPHTKGGPKQWPETITLKGSIGSEKPYATDVIPLPEENPWGSKIRFSGFDFFSDGTSLAATTWNGDVWVATGIDESLEKVVWKRYASGLFETLGLKIVDDMVYVTGKDQITRLHDLNKDGEADFYECFNNDIWITKNFHEFTFGLETDKKGNFYFAKGAPVRRGGRGFEATHHHHGIVFKVSKDGKKSEIHASGLRAPGGLGVGPDGQVTTGENEGTYVPKCKINWATPGSFHGVIHPGNKRSMEQGYDPPLCWMPMDVDNSGGGQVWVSSDKWGPFKGELLHLSYGRSSIYKVLKEEVKGRVQGGVVKLPVKLMSSAMRGRFNPRDGQLYVSGFRGWQTNAAKPSSIQRVRYTGDPLAIPTGMRVTKKGVYLTFTQKLDKELAEDVTSYDVSWWQYVWGPQYGSGHFSIDNPDEEALAAALKQETKGKGTRGSGVHKDGFNGDKVTVKSATLQSDGKTVFLEIPTIKPVMQMKIGIDVETEDGEVIITSVYNTIHELGDK